MPSVMLGVFLWYNFFRMVDRMNILIKELESFVTKNNKKIVQRLISVLMENNIDTYSEL